ncbi:MAG TPA: hypothetical protein VMU26_31185 [Candidatus Polarisedimenticolia bacterium]|nr:hypothetical protein [Candidatus Polarisedimenticolia bacterium]
MESSPLTPLLFEAGSHCTSKARLWANCGTPITHPLGYSWFVDDDVVMVTHSGAPQGSKNLLDSRIPEFTFKRDATLQAASLWAGCTTVMNGAA